MIEELSALIPRKHPTTPGKVFYSGQAAFSSPSKLYILGLNPGGSPEEEASETVELDAERVLNKAADWSAYRDEEWKDQPKGTHGMQPRVLHLLRQLKLNPGHVPASNVVFKRSAQEKHLENFHELAELCWPFHQYVLDHLGVRVILCFGKTSGRWVCKRLNATDHIDTFVETNGRKWKSRAFRNADGVVVVVAAHPSRADWTTPEADPTPLVRRMLERA